jgi:nitrogen-specific signal transduction histidine kinase
MHLKGGPASVRIKIALVVFAILIGAGTILYTNTLVKRLEQKEKQVVQLFADGLQYVANANSESTDITFLFEKIIRPIDFPMVLTDKNDSVSTFDQSSIRNIEFDANQPKEKLKKFFDQTLSEMDAVHKPIEVKFVNGKDTIVIQKIHFGESKLIKQLRYYPFIQLLLAFFFVIIGYLSFSHIKKSEQSNIWVGMAKETAHQFGTPISSLMGWLELLRINYRDQDKVQDIAEEVQNDVERLQKITMRFSKIGSKPELKKQNVTEVIQKVVDYFQRRIPQTGKRVSLTVQGSPEADAMLSAELFEWVIENLIKNALDAIEQKEGKIEFVIANNKNKVEIEAVDDGKGIDMNRRKDVFRPGYSTKRRGWGLGLSLSKRIVEDYHKGKIFVKSSAPGAGTIFKIILPKA